MNTSRPQIKGGRKASEHKQIYKIATDISPRLPEISGVGEDIHADSNPGKGSLRTLLQTFGQPLKGSLPSVEPTA